MTESALKDTAGFFKEDDPATAQHENTLGRWGKDAKEYGKNTVKQLTQSADFIKGLGEVVQDTWREIQAQQVNTEAIDPQLKQIYGDQQAEAMVKNFVRNGYSEEDAQRIMGSYSDQLLAVAKISDGYNQQVVEQETQAQALKPNIGTAFQNDNETVITARHNPTTGQKLFQVLGETRDFVEELPSEEAEMLMIGVQAAMGPAKAAVSVAGNYLVNTFFGEDIAVAQETLAIKADAAVSPGLGKDAIRDIHEDAKQNSGKGDSEVRGAEFAVAVVAGLGAGVLGKKGSEADAGATRVESVVTKSGLKPGSMSNEAVRKWYHKNLDNVASQIDSSLPLKEQALQAFKLRNQIKLEARELMSDRAAAEALPAPKTLQDVVRKAYQQGHTGDDVWRYMLGSSARSNKNVDAALGLSR